MQAQVERCPWCDSQITRIRFVQIENKIRDEERQRIATAEAAVRKELEDKHRRDLEAKLRAAAAKGLEDANRRFTAVIAERDALAAKMKLADARVAAAKQAAADAVAAKLSALTKRAEAAETREADVRKRAQDEVARQVGAALKQAEQQQQKQLREVRAILQKDKDHELLKERAAFGRERASFEKKIMELQRQVQKKTANEVGDGAEIDLYEALREAFDGDRITRVPKGQPGADIAHEILHKGEVCGRIIYDSKNRLAWQYGFAEKLRADQLAAKADHAILASTVFPSGKKELCIESDVIVVSPARVIPVVELLRNFLIRMRLLNLSAKAKTGKMNGIAPIVSTHG